MCVCVCLCVCMCMYLSLFSTSNTVGVGYCSFQRYNSLFILNQLSDLVNIALGATLYFITIQLSELTTVVI